MAKIKYDAKTLITEDDVENKFLQELFTKELGYDINKDLKWKESVKYQEGRKKLTKFLAIYCGKSQYAFCARRFAECDGENLLCKLHLHESLTTRYCGGALLFSTIKKIEHAFYFRKKGFFVEKRGFFQLCARKLFLANFFEFAYTCEQRWWKVGMSGAKCHEKPIRCPKRKGSGRHERSLWVL